MSEQVNSLHDCYCFMNTVIDLSRGKMFSNLCFYFDNTLTDIITIATKADRLYTGLTRFNKQVRFHCFQNMNQKDSKNVCIKAILSCVK